MREGLEDLLFFCVSRKKRYNSECDWRKMHERFTLLFRIRRQGMGKNR